jgi:hypothetical protein
VLLGHAPQQHTLKPDLQKILVTDCHEKESNVLLEIMISVSLGLI